MRCQAFVGLFSGFIGCLSGEEPRRDVNARRGLEDIQRCIVQIDVTRAAILSLRQVQRNLLQVEMLVGAPQHFLAAQAGQDQGRNSVSGNAIHVQPCSSENLTDLIRRKEVIFLVRLHQLLQVGAERLIDPFPRYGQIEEDAQQSVERNAVLG